MQTQHHQGGSVISFHGNKSLIVSVKHHKFESFRNFQDPLRSSDQEGPVSREVFCCWKWAMDATSLRQVAMESDVAASFSPDGSTCETISLWTMFPLVPSGVRYDLWCLGNKLNAELVLTYLYFWLRHLPALPIATKIGVGLMFPDHVDEKEIGHLCNNTCPIVSAQTIYCRKVAIVDQTIQKLP